MDFIAHKSQDYRTQPLKDHLCGVSEIAYSEGKSIGAGNICKLAGLIHDAGKYCDSFQKHITENTVNSEEHAYSGAKIINEMYMSGTSIERHLAEFLGKVVFMHHGTQDFPNFFKIIESPKNYDEVKINFFNEISAPEIRTIFSLACEEFITISKKIDELYKSLLTKKKSNYANASKQMYFGMFARYVFSVLRYADMKDCINFNKEYEEKLTIDWKTVLINIENN